MIGAAWSTMQGLKLRENELEQKTVDQMEM